MDLGTDYCYAGVPLTLCWSLARGLLGCYISSIYLLAIISTAPDPQGSSRVDILTHPYTTAAYAARVVTVTAGRTARAVATTITEGYAT